MCIAGLAGFFLLEGCTAAVGLPERSSYPLPPSKQDCSLCHIDAAQGTPALKQRLSDLCFSCHADRRAPNEHAVDIVPSLEVSGLPLFEGRMTCVTCHDPHTNPYGSLLRKPEAELCLSCHPL